MTELEFIAINPGTSYGAGAAGLLYSSSVSGSGNTPVAPFELRGLTLPVTSKSGEDVTYALRQVTEFTFDISGSSYTSKVLSKQLKSGYVFFRMSPTSLSALPTTVDASDNPAWDNSEFVFVPYLPSNFTNSDYNPLLNNSETSRINDFKRVVDRMDSQFVPTNLTAIIAGTAEKAELQFSNYTDSGLKNSRYDGVTENSGSIPFEDPAITLRKCQGSIHPLRASNVRLRGTGLNDSGSVERDVVDIYFRVDTRPTGLVPTGQNYISGSGTQPTIKGTYGAGGKISGSLCYEKAENEDFIKISDKKIFIEESGDILTTNELGQVKEINLLVGVGSSNDIFIISSSYQAEAF